MPLYSVLGDGHFIQRKKLDVFEACTEKATESSSQLIFNGDSFELQRKNKPPLRVQVAPLIRALQCHIARTGLRVLFLRGNHDESLTTEMLQDALRQSGANELAEHCTVHEPFGYELPDDPSVLITHGHCLPFFSRSKLSNTVQLKTLLTTKDSTLVHGIREHVAEEIDGLFLDESMPNLVPSAAKLAVALGYKLIVHGHDHSATNRFVYVSDRENNYHRVIVASSGAFVGTRSKVRMACIDTDNGTITSEELTTDGIFDTRAVSLYKKIESK